MFRACSRSTSRACLSTRGFRSAIPAVHNKILPNRRLIGSSRVRHHGHSHGPRHADSGSHSRAGQKITLVGVGLNIGLTAAKAVVGVLANSASMLADAVHSLSDLVSDGATLLAVRFSRRAPTLSFPYGFGKLETFGAVAIAGVLLSAGGGMGWHSLQLLLNHPTNIAAANGPLYAALAIAGLSILTKEALFQATMRIAARTSSPVLVANAWHHRTDALSSIVAMGGVTGNVMGVPWLDPLCGLAVSAMVVRMGWSIGTEGLCELLDGASPDQALVRDAAVQAAHPMPVQFCRARRAGPYTFVDIRVGVRPTLTTAETAEIAQRIKFEMERSFPGESVVVTEPVCRPVKPM